MLFRVRLEAESKDVMIGKEDPVVGEIGLWMTMNFYSYVIKTVMFLFAYLKLNALIFGTASLIWKYISVFKVLLNITQRLLGVE